MRYAKCTKFLSIFVLQKSTETPLGAPPLYSLTTPPPLSSVAPQSREILELWLGPEEAFPSGLNTPSSMEILPPGLALRLPALRSPFSHPLSLLWRGGHQDPPAGPKRMREVEQSCPSDILYFTLD
jgi:hypothetical protein